MSAYAQEDWTQARREIHENILLSGSNLAAYVDPAPDYRLTSTPKGYEPFYLSHYGRHGSRWLTAESQYTDAIEPLQKARKEGKLTAKGEALLDSLEDFYKCCDKRFGDLTTVGERQHHRIGRRMTQRFPEIFGAKNAEVDARSTVVLRCVLSMIAECEELTAYNPRLRIHNDASESLQYYMNARETSEVSEAMKPRDEIAGKYRRKWIHPERFCAMLFSDADYVREHVDQSKLMRRVFSVCCNMQSHDNGKDLWPYFTEEECYDLWRAHNVQWYLGFGNALPTRGAASLRQRLLLRNFLETADTIVGRKTFHGATLRFGHETVVMPLALIMELGNVAETVENLDTLDRVWANYRIFPMASNVQLVFYRPKKHRQGDILVKALLNEREVSLPVKPVQYPYYRWDDLRAYYEKKL
ncbi:MAG: histidine-type phosphatase [Bacteroidaceae bacterium]|nr:histidine-type phosphatase [Bacteroidaceae bacterium]